MNWTAIGVVAATVVAVAAIPRGRWRELRQTVQGISRAVARPFQAAWARRRAGQMGRDVIECLRGSRPQSWVQRDLESVVGSLINRYPEAQVRHTVQQLADRRLIDCRKVNESLWMLTATDRGKRAVE